MVGKEAATFIREHLVGDARREVNGRGAKVLEDPGEIFDVLARVFGDGNTLPQLQQKFYSFQQGNGQDLLACSLQLVEMYDRMVTLDKSNESQRENALKNRFAEAVRDESLKRELRRLNLDKPGLTFFELRDRALQWLGPSLKEPKEATIKTISTDQGVLELLKKQAEQMERQQKQLDQLQSLLFSRRPGPPRGPRTCWNCGREGHFRSNCPNPARSQPEATPVMGPSSRRENLNE